MQVGRRWQERARNYHHCGLQDCEDVEAWALAGGGKTGNWGRTGPWGEEQGEG